MQRCWALFSVKCEVWMFCCVVGSTEGQLYYELYVSTWLDAAATNGWWRYSVRRPDVDRPNRLIQTGPWLDSDYSQLVMCECSKFRIESNSYFSIRFDSKRAQLFEIFQYWVQENDVSVKMCMCTVLLLTVVQVLYLHEVLYWPIMAQQVLKLLQQKPQQCGAIKTVEFI